MPYNEVWRRGPLELTLPALCDWYPPDLKAAVQAFRLSALDGSCAACGAVSRMTVGDWRFEHGEACPVGREAIEMLANAAALDMPADNPDALPDEA
ncbi:hypothetical protein [Streptomyces sp. AC512_CC834]|uniref:hypothetical protein n=1 Tax=Streptomyces sp. AC512_CC834 TaxID=2823691 RepID=UPI001C25C453|nr:hypothetical protein [Streptomyces sp. AC512_CC834]